MIGSNYAKDLLSKQLLELVGVIKTFDADNYQEKS